MVASFLWGLLAAGSLLLGAFIAFYRAPGRRTVGLVMGFGSGVLLSAVSFELVVPAVAGGDGVAGAAVGFFVGAATFTVGDILIGRFAARQARDGGDATESSGLSIVLGALLDGVPETAVLGLTLLQTGQVGVTMLVAVFVSNIPEAIAATTGLIKGGWGKSSIVWLWSVVVFASASAAALGYVFLDGAGPSTLGFIYAFAAGAILTMLATSMIPEAYEKAGRAVGFVTVLGYAVAFGIDAIS